jgi:pimeloyl-ACP methyl ester carboxylesterase
VGLELLLIAFLLCGGCRFASLEREIKYAEQNAALLRGEVLAGAVDYGSVIVVLWSVDDPNHSIQLHWFMHGAGGFRFTVLAPARYRLLAFEDRNGDLIYQRGEPAGMCQNPPIVEAEPGQRLEGLRIALKEDGPRVVDFEVKLPRSAEIVSIDEYDISVGEVVTITDPRFNEENAGFGVWEPIRFLREVGHGIYFLEEFDPEKTPVLFVHGVSGHPRQWEDVIGHLDRRRFQPWVFYYPSGVSLRRTSEALYTLTERLRMRHNFSSLYVVAHSMGGLVSRAFINETSRRDSPLRIPVFVTISTPWGGHEAAEMGVKHAPAVVSSWRDMAPGSPFQQGLWEEPLPGETAYTLVFGYRGESSMFMDRDNDGTVALVSVLDTKAQMAASRVYGFHENHVSILSSQDTLNLLNAVLEE